VATTAFGSTRTCRYVASLSPSTTELLPNDVILEVKQNRPYLSLMNQKKVALQSPMRVSSN
jgi:hypothetical protein